MYLDLLKDTCVIYRMDDYDAYDFSASLEGEVSEVWSIVAAGVKCRFDGAYSGTERLSGGPIESGRFVIFFKVGQDIQDSDRVYMNSKWYSVVDTDTIPGFIDDHHKEVVVALMDRAT